MGRSIVFAEPGFVYLQGNDAWAHARSIDYLTHNFPHRLLFDPFSAWPDGQPAGMAPLFNVLVAVTALALGGGTPSELLTHTVLAWAPVVLAALLPIPVWLLGRRMFGSETAGLAAAWFIALMPGHFHFVSKLGFGDHHILETLLACTGMLALVEATLSDGRTRRRWTAFAAVVWSAYLAAWVAAALLIGVLVAWAGLELLTAHLRRTEPTDVVGMLLPILLLGWLSIQFEAPHVWTLITQVALPFGLAALLLLAGLFRLSQRRGWPLWAAPAGVTAAVAAMAAAGAVAAPAQFAFILDKVMLAAPDARYQTIAEMRPLVVFNGPWFWVPLWEQFRMTFPLAVVGAAFAFESRAAIAPPVRRLLLLWTVVFFALSLMENRATYYLAVNLSLLAGFALSEIAQRLSPPRWQTAAMAALALFAVLPDAAGIEAQYGRYYPVFTDYRKAYEYLRTQTPEPLGADGFYARFVRPPEGQPYPYPPSAYGVMNWWDIGHHVTALGRRIPVANPYQSGAETAATFFLERDPAIAVEQLRQLRARYVIVGPDMLMNRLEDMHPGSGGIDTMPQWINRRRSDMYRMAIREEPTVVRQMLVFFPAYFETMAARLALYAGEATEAESITLVRLELDQDEWWVEDAKSFDTVDERAAFLAEHPDEGWQVASVNPYHTCVPLEAAPGLRLAYKSQFRTLPAVKVFEVDDHPAPSLLSAAP